MKIAIGQVSHETNTFSNVLTTAEHFKNWEWANQDEVIENNTNVKDYLGGMIDQSKDLNIELIPIFSAAALPSGMIQAETYQSIKENFIKNFPSKEEIDGICLALHGAGVVEGIDDMEGDFLEFLRNKVGYDIPIVVTLDLHGNITGKIVENADLLLGVKLYPHTDSYEKGKEAISRLYQMIQQEIQPKTILKKLPLLIPTCTSSLYPVTKINEKCWDFEKQDKVIDCTFFHGFPYTDVPFAGASVIVTTHDDEKLAETIAYSIKNFIWNERESFFGKSLSPIEGIQKALQSSNYPVVINETSDNPGAGTPCDGTYLLRAMLDAELENACIGVIYDPEVVELAHKQGVGTTIETYLGGKTDNMHGEPVYIKGYVKTLSDGVFFQTSPMWNGKKVDLKKSVRIQVGGLDIIVGCIRNQVFDDQVFIIHGIDVYKKKIVGIKSSQHFRASFESIAKEIITVDSPGLSTLQLDRFNYQKLKRPIYPIDDVSKLEIYKLEGEKVK